MVYQVNRAQWVLVGHNGYCYHHGNFCCDLSEFFMAVSSWYMTRICLIPFNLSIHSEQHISQCPILTQTKSRFTQDSTAMVTGMLQATGFLVTQIYLKVSHFPPTLWPQVVELIIHWPVRYLCAGEVELGSQPRSGVHETQDGSQDAWRPCNKCLLGNMCCLSQGVHSYWFKHLYVVLGDR